MNNEYVRVNLPVIKVRLRNGEVYKGYPYHSCDKDMAHVDYLVYGKWHTSTHSWASVEYSYNNDLPLDVHR